MGGGVSMEEVVLGAEKSVQLVCFASSETRELENGYCVWLAGHVLGPDQRA